MYITYVYTVAETTHICFLFELAMRCEYSPLQTFQTYLD